MSTKTTFKRIALVAVAALGLGVLSVAPSSAVVSVLTVTGANGTATLSTIGGNTDSSTAALITIAGLLDDSRDSVTVTFVPKSVPSGSSAAVRLYYIDTTTPTSGTIVDSASAVTVAGQAAVPWVLATSTHVGVVSGTNLLRIRNHTTGYVGANFGIQLDSTTTRIAGTYTYTVVVKSYNANGTLNVANSTTTTDVSIVVPVSAATAAAEVIAEELLSGTIAPALSTAYLNAGSTVSTDSDSSVAVVSTASATDHAAIRVRTYTVDANPAPETVTATVTGAGVVCSGGTICGKSLTILGTAGDNTFTIRADGTSGTGSIVIKTTTVTFSAKTVTFFAAAASTVTAAVNKPVIGIGTTTDVIRAVMTDASGSVWGGAAYIYAATAADALVSGSLTTPVACTFVAAYGYHACPSTSAAVGTANLKVIDASTVALATATSASIAATVSAGTPTTVKIAFDKATYAPGEKATVSVSVLDATGAIIPTTGSTARTVANVFTATGITASTALTGAALTSADAVVQGATSAALGTTAGAQNYVVYMPMASGDVTLTATGSTGLAAAGRVAVTATASVVNSSVDAATDAANEATDAANAATDAALAAADSADAATEAAQEASDAVAELSTQVAALMASLKAQIKSLTNLVIKIQKKLK